MGNINIKIFKDMSYSIVYRKYMRNPLLQRRQMIIDIKHHNLPPISKSELQKKIAFEQNVNETNCVSLFGFRTHFGGSKTTGFCLIYDSESALLKFEPKYRLRRKGLIKERNNSAKQ